MNRQKSIELAGRVDLGLVGGLGLAEHGGRGELLAPRSGQQVGGAQEHRGALVERQSPPSRPWPAIAASTAAVASACPALVSVPSTARVPVRLDDVDALAVAHPVRAADDVRQVDRVGGEACRAPR